MKWDIGAIAWVPGSSGLPGAVVFLSAPSQNTIRHALSCDAEQRRLGRTRWFRTQTPGRRKQGLLDSNDTANGHSGYVLSCNLALVPPCTPATVLARTYSDPINIQVVGNTLYWLAPGRQDVNEGRLHSCTLPACPTVTDLALGLNSPTEMLADSAGLYVVDAAGAIQRCVNTPCGGGIQSWLSGTAPRFLTSDSKFLYWAEGTIVRRVAK